MALLHAAVSWSEMCDCGISSQYWESKIVIQFSYESVKYSSYDVK